MRRYFFDFRDGDELIPDEEGVEITTLEAVQDEAARALADMAKDELNRVPDGNGSSPRHFCIEVRDRLGPVMLATFSFEIKRMS